MAPPRDRGLVIEERNPVAAAAGPPEAGPGGATRSAEGLGRTRPLKPGSLRERVHGNPALLLSWRIGVFVLGLLFVLLGIALTALPGPLTIPPVLVGLWVWSTEFAWAARFFAAFRRKAQDAWRHARQHPISSAAVTVGGLAAAGAVFWAVGHYRLIEQARIALGI
jgi:hypothetical protein